MRGIYGIMSTIILSDYNITKVIHQMRDIFKCLGM